MSDETDHAHAPLPYVVVLRAAVSEDGPVERFEQHVVAYSIYEAMWAAIVEATGSAVIERKRCTIESVRPDMAAYAALVLQRAMARLDEAAARRDRKP